MRWLSPPDKVPEARARVRTALERVGHERVVGGEITEAPPLEAIEDAFATFTPDEVIVATGWEEGAGGLEPQLAGHVRDRFAVPVRHLVFAPGSEAREPSLDTERRAVGAHMGHCLNDVGNRDDSCWLDDLTPRQTCRVTRSVHPLVVLQGNLCHRPGQ